MLTDHKTPARFRALQWIASHEPVALFPVDGPSFTMVKTLVALGLVEQCGVQRDGSRFGLRQYRVSKAGVAALREWK